MTITKDPNLMMKRWMEIYMNLSIIQSTNEDVSNILDEMKMKLAECNEHVMKFFDAVDADPEKVQGGGND